MAETIEFRRADEVDPRAVAEVYVDGFGPDLAYFTKDPALLARALEHALVPEYFHVALIDGEPAAMAFLVTEGQQAFRHDAAELRRHLGWYKGTIADLVFRSQFQRPMSDPGPGRAEIGFVASAKKHQGRGAAKALLRHLLELPDHHEYRLEDIADVNERALGLYEGLGFREYRRRPLWHARWSGINSYVGVKLVQG